MPPLALFTIAPAIDIPVPVLPVGKVDVIVIALGLAAEKLAVLSTLTAAPAVCVYAFALDAANVCKVADKATC